MLLQTRQVGVNVAETRKGQVIGADRQNPLVKWSPERAPADREEGAL